MMLAGIVIRAPLLFGDEGVTDSCPRRLIPVSPFAVLTDIGSIRFTSEHSGRQVHREATTVSEARRTSYASLGSLWALVFWATLPARIAARVNVDALKW